AIANTLPATHCCAIKQSGKWQYGPATTNRLFFKTTTDTAQLAALAGSPCYIDNRIFMLGNF
ncbi:MAG: hypothetical protein EAZ16_13560, partial [Sphingobacteriales bacterium]